MTKAEKVDKKEIAEALKKANSVAIFGHVLPDGDCLGSVFGMKLALESMEKRAYVFLDEEIPYYLDFLKDYSNLHTEKEFRDTDIVLVFDSSQVNRVESENILQDYKERGVKIYQIDHHLPGNLNDFADYFWQDQDFSSTSEMALLIIKKMGIRIKKDVATLLLTGIEGDTGSFQHQNTTSRSLESAAYLVSKGARFGSIVENTLNSKKELNILKLYGLALERLVYNKKYKTLTSYLTLEDAKKFGVKGNSYSEIINFFSIVGGIKIIILITEREEGLLKVSLRTRDEYVDVQKLAANFGGGGHIKASGFSIKGKIIEENGRVKVV
jgi:phosphoesterase RecJ-like protein